jgi:class 3 adenylate cyclase
MAAEVNEQLLDERLAELEKARAWSPRLVSKLESHIRSADEEGLFRVNPFTFAREKNLKETEIIDLFLYATSLGLFEMDWQLLCQQCSCVVESFGSLKGLHSQFHCNICQVDYEATLDDYIAVTFTVGRQIRDIAFHHPERLSASDYFRMGGTPDGVLPDGTRFIDFQAKVIKALGFLPPRETTRFTIEMESDGIILGVSPEGKVALLYTVSGVNAPGEQMVPVHFEHPVSTHTTGNLAPGRITFAVENATAERGSFFVAVLPPNFEFGHAPIKFLPFLTGKRLLTTQAFRDLFRSEVIRASEGIGVKDIALLFTDLKGSTALYDRLGDLNAFSLVQQHFEHLLAVTQRFNGAIIKTIGDAVMAAFLNPLDAVGAALAMRDAISSFNRAQPDRELILKIGVHKGAAIAVTLNDRLDYFGQTVNIAARVQHLANADEIYLSDSVHNAEGVRQLLAPFEPETSIAQLKGVRQDMHVWRVAAPAVREGPAAILAG